MRDYFDIVLGGDELSRISNLGLAHMGDAVYELLVRTMLCAAGGATSKELHREAIARVSAGAQAQAVKKLLPLLTEEEETVYRRGRNAHVHSVPAHASQGDYHAATGLETLFGYLYLRGEKTRISELFSAIWEVE